MYYTAGDLIVLVLFYGWVTTTSKVLTQSVRFWSFSLAVFLSAYSDMHAHTTAWTVETVRVARLGDIDGQYNLHNRRIKEGENGSNDDRT